MQDYEPKTFINFNNQDIPAEKIIEAIIILVDNGIIIPCQDLEVVDKVKNKCNNLNSYIASRSKYNDSIYVLASPVTGGGINVSRIDMLILDQLYQGYKTIDEITNNLWDFMDSQGQKLVEGDRTLETTEENIAKLKTKTETFFNNQFHLLKALQII